MKKISVEKNNLKIKDFDWVYELLGWEEWKTKKKKT